MPLASFSRTVSSSSCTETAPSKRSTILPGGRERQAPCEPHSPTQRCPFAGPFILGRLDVDEAHVAVIEGNGPSPRRRPRRGRVRLAQNFGVENVTTKGAPAQATRRPSAGGASRPAACAWSAWRRRRQSTRVSACRTPVPGRPRPARGPPRPRRRCERLDAPASVRLRERPVLPGPGEVDVGDVDVGRVGLGACLGRRCARASPWSRGRAPTRALWTSTLVPPGARPHAPRRRRRGTRRERRPVGGSRSRRRSLHRRPAHASSSSLPLSRIGTRGPVPPNHRRRREADTTPRSVPQPGAYAPESVDEVAA